MVIEPEEVYEEGSSDNTLFNVIIASIILSTIIIVTFLFVLSPKYESVFTNAVVIEKEFIPRSYRRYEEYFLICKNSRGDILKINVEYKDFYRFDKNDPIILKENVEKK